MSNIPIQRRQEPAALPSEWVRPPRPTERIEGHSRAELYDLAAQGKIRSKAIRKPGTKRDIRLFHVPSIRAYIESIPDEDKEAA